jgi:hypothetical protein
MDGTSGTPLEIVYGEVVFSTNSASHLSALKRGSYLQLAPRPSEEAIG